DLRRVGELRDDAWRDVAADLDFPHAGGGDRGDPFHLVIGRHAGFGDLQPVARSDIANRNEFAHGSGISALRMVPVSDSVMTSVRPSGASAQLVVMRPCSDCTRYN